MILTKNWVFSVFFNYKDEAGRARAEVQRGEFLIYLKKTMERVARFSVIAKNADRDDSSYLLLTGYVSMKNQCTQVHVKKLLGKHSHCKASGLGDVINLMRFYNIDKRLTVTGVFPCGGHKSTPDDSEWAMRVIHDGFKEQHEVKGIKVDAGVVI